MNKISFVLLLLLFACTNKDTCVSNFRGHSVFSPDVNYQMKGRWEFGSFRRAPVVTERAIELEAVLLQVLTLDASVSVLFDEITSVECNDFGCHTIFLHRERNTPLLSNAISKTILANGQTFWCGDLTRTSFWWFP